MEYYFLLHYLYYYLLSKNVIIYLKKTRVYVYPYHSLLTLSDVFERLSFGATAAALPVVASTSSVTVVAIVVGAAVSTCFSRRCCRKPCCSVRIATPISTINKILERIRGGTMILSSTPRVMPKTRAGINTVASEKSINERVWSQGWLKSME